MIALLLLSAGIICLAYIQLAAVTARAPMAPTGMRTATDLAQEEIDRLQDVAWNELRSAGDDISIRGTMYHRTWQVMEDPEIPNLKDISVQCRWKQEDGRWRRILLVTQRSNAER